MKMKIRLLANFNSKISFVGSLYESIVKIKTLSLHKELFKFTSNIKPKDFKLLTHTSKISGPAKNLLTINTCIKFKNIKLLLNSNTMLNFKFFIDKEKYSEYSPIIYNNIDDLYIRISGMYKTVSNKFINDYGMNYVKDSYELTEQIFNYILSDLQEYKEYSEITDRVIMKEIVMYFRGL